MSRKRTNSDRISNQLFVALCTSQNIGGVFWKAKSELPFTKIFEFTKRSSKHPYTRDVIQSTFFPKDHSDFNLSITNSVPVFSEISHSLGLIEGFSESISKFIKLKQKFERAYLLSDEKVIHRVLLEIEQVFGLSLWLIEAKVASAQIIEGNVARRRITNVLAGEETFDPFFRWITRQFSSRAEPDVRPSVFTDSVSELTSDYLKARDPLGSTICFRLIPWYQWYLLDYNKIVPFSRLPIVDQISYLPYLVTHSKFELNRYNLSSATNEILSSLGLKVSKCRGNVPDDGFGQFVELYTAGKYQECLQNILQAPFQTASIITLAASAFARTNGSKACLEKIENSVLYSLIVSLAEIQTLRTNPRSAVETVMKISMNQPFASWAEGLARAALNYHGGSKSDWHLSSTVVSGLFESQLNPLVSNVSLNENSSQTAQFLEWCNDIGPNSHLKADVENLSVDPSRLLFYRAMRHSKMGNDGSAFQAWLELLNASDPVYRIRAFREVIIRQVESGEIESARRLLSQEFLRNPNIVWAIKELAPKFHPRTEVSVDTEQEFYSLVCFSIFNHLDTSESLRSIAAILLEKLIEAGNGSLPDFVDQLNAPQGLKIYLLQVVATVQILEDTVCFDSQEAIEKQRLKICQWLVANDPTREIEYRSEIQKITRQQVMRKHRRNVEHTKIYVDEQNLKSQLTALIGDKYEQIPLLTEIAAFSAIESFHIIYRNEQKKNKEITLLNSSQVLNQQIDDMALVCFEQYSSSPQYGLDAYLSSRIRHGTMMGHLRKPFESEHLTTSFDVEINNYKPNEYWIDHISNSYDFIDQLNCAFSKLSAKIDSIITKFKEEQIQVSTRPDTNALFVFYYDEDCKAKIRDVAKRTKSRDIFIDEIFEVLRDILSINLSEVRRQISHSLYKPLDEALTEFESDFASASRGSPSFLLNDALARARTDIQRATLQMKEWFSSDPEINFLPFTLDLVVEFVEEQLKTVYPNHQVSVVKTITCDQEISGKYLPFFIDILYILFDNAVRYGSNSERKCTISMEASSENGIGLKILVQNKLTKGTNFKELDSKVDFLTSQLANPLHASRKEGETGLLKIKKILNWDLNVEGDYTFERKGKGFEVNIKFPLGSLCEF